MCKVIIQSGIKEVIYLSDKYANSENNIASRRLFDKCGIKYSKIDIEGSKKIEIELKKDSLVLILKSFFHYNPIIFIIIIFSNRNILKTKIVI